MEFQENEMFRLVYYKYFSTASKHITEQLTKSSKTKVSKTAALKAPTEKKIEEPELDLETAIQQKRDLKQMKDSYDPESVEKYWYKFWKNNKYFHAPLDKALQAPHEKKFTMVIPPPNVTSYLHIGHALFVAIEDAMTRWHRMRGDVSCWLPGLDHAGIGTQSVVEKTLLKQGINKNDLGREKFLDKVWEWKEKHGNGILLQFEKLGASVDWDRFAFTLDPKLNKAVTEAFIRLHERGLIYRSYRLVNWSCKLQTALSDVEVYYEEINEPTLKTIAGHTGKYEFGVLVSFAYKVKGTNEEIVVATTRIETMLGDTAVAVHSSDERYKHLIGKELEHPFVPNRVIKVIADDELVDPKYGTGAVKVTPAHDNNDFKCGMRNKLEFVNILNNDGTINDNGGQYKGMKRFDVRNQIIKDLEAKGLYRGTSKNPMRLGFCQRSGDVIEPLLRPQWYVDCKDIKDPMLKAVEKKDLKIIPENFEHEWNEWIGNLKDWCISRQLWWGHRVPAYLVTIKSKGITPDMNDEKHWVCAHSHEDALEKAAAKYGVDKSEITLSQDEDVLDTWFSSALFPFAPFGWPDVKDNKELEAFYPGHVLETGHDILFFWVARMVMMGLLLTEKLPFHTVYLHNLVRDKDGEKMSKSKGNVIDPLDVIHGTTLESLLERLTQGNLSKDEIAYHTERRKQDYPQGIPACGTDALRYSLVAHCIQARYMNMDVKRTISDRLFLNKVWNSYKFGLSKLSADFKYDINNIKVDKLSLADKWVLGNFEACIKEMNKCFEEYKFGELTLAFHKFWLYEFCDIYLEAIKPVFYQEGADTIPTQTVLFTILEQGMRLIHPLMPFISEELYQKLPAWPGKKESIVIAPYPTSNGWNIDAAKINEQFDFLYGLVKTIRSLAASVNLPNNAKPAVYGAFLKSGAEIASLKEAIAQDTNMVLTLSKSGSFAVVANKSDVPEGCVMDVSGNLIEVYLNVKANIDIPKEIERLEKKIESNLKFMKALEAKMSAKEYETKVPEKVRIENKEKYDGYVSDNVKLQEALENFKKMK